MFDAEGESILSYIVILVRCHDYLISVWCKRSPPPPYVASLPRRICSAVRTGYITSACRVLSKLNTIQVHRLSGGLRVLLGLVCVQGCVLFVSVYNVMCSQPRLKDVCRAQDQTASVTRGHALNPSGMRTRDPRLPCRCSMTQSMRLS